ncbi:hypothetical protein G6O69_01780 [Pseudenhygromyxa sp. WMMC2535]|uniref:hypothetical protein n=1 Tax=Pseudenhygromyxa sp. WMMC2535 TaxID=2712867 RepID=UPI0015568106|nr:hypothetical protein [Pseudenhygromyxa sp. WMMC2535]NVB36544.1 hypothetical protein [Pseudenhygromyxa sp. WMMC2535]
MELRDGQLPRDPSAAAIVNMAITELSSVSELRARVSPRGFVWRGRPPHMTNTRLAELQVEARGGRGSSYVTTRPLIAHWDPQPGGAAQELAHDPGQIAWLEGLVGATDPTVEPAPVYHYYDRSGAGIAPHIDEPRFSLITHYLVAHEASGPKRSAFFVYPVGREPQRVELAPGEAVIVYSGAVVHARTAVAPGESVTTLSIGYRLDSGTEGVDVDASR